MGRWKRIRNNAKANLNGPIELYDLDADPAEKADVSSKHPHTVRRIAEIMPESTGGRTSRSGTSLSR